MCAGAHLGNRELYTAYIRIITAFELLPPKDSADAPIIDAIECNSTPTALVADPKKFKIGLRVRDQAKLDEWIAEAEQRTKDL